MNLAVDFGNSAAKVGIFDNRNLVSKETFPSSEGLRDFLGSSGARQIIVSSVSVPAEDIIAWSGADIKLVLSPKLSLPITNLYKTPETLGVDRLASVCGARALFPGQQCLVIDAGTCITFDFIDRDGNYHGGAISPGLSMRFRAMNNFTARLPLVRAVKQPKLVGDSTESSMQSGVINGMMFEIEGAIRHYQERFGSIKAVLCGGDTAFFENQLKASIFACPELVLHGLNSILIHNVSQ